MPASITIVCPECDKEMKAPPDVEGKKVRCKGCGKAFVARVDDDEDEDEAPRKKPAAKKPAPKKPEAKKPEPKKGGGEDDPYGLTFEDLSARCPECAQLMESETAKVCLYCGFNTETRERSRTRKVKDVTGGDIFLWLLPGIACAIAALLMITWIIIHWGPLAGWLGIDVTKDADKETWTFLAVALYTKLWTTIPLLFLIYKATYFAVVRLILHPRPPEIEEKMGQKK